MGKQLNEVIELLESLCSDPSISRNVRSILEAIKLDLDKREEIGIRIDAALQKVEDISLDPNLSTYARAQIWNLTSKLESVNSVSAN